jgi:pimeloyl-ACP methyl ester carboxylesterase
VDLTEEWEWRGRRVRWARAGSGPDAVFCHGTPWSSTLWTPYAQALREQFTVYLWDMPGYGQSSKLEDHRVSLDVQGELLAELLVHWRVEAPHVVAHDYGGAVALRAHLLHGSMFASLALVDVVAVAPWGSEFFRLVCEHPDVFAALPRPIHAGMIRAYVMGASHVGLTASQVDALV